MAGRASSGTQNLLECGVGLEADADTDTGTVHVDAFVFGKDSTEPVLEIDHEPLPGPHRAGADDEHRLGEGAG